MSNHARHSLGRRLMPAVAMTAAAAGLLTLLDRPSNGSAGAVLGGGALGGAGPLGSTPETEPPVVSSTVPIQVLPVGGDDDGAESEGEDDNGNPAPVQPAQTTVPTPTTPAQPAPSGACNGNVVDGPTVKTRWGPVQVEAVVTTDKRICDVSAIQYPSSRSRSVAINEQALPILHDQVLRAQSANIRGVSGATITSDAYVRSLQAILDGNGG
jgi:uncharacterized protein with FMN-binding domain